MCHMRTSVITVVDGVLGLFGGNSDRIIEEITYSPCL